MQREKNITSGIKILTIKYAASTLPESAVFQGGRADKRIPITFVIYLLITGQQRILVDTMHTMIILQLWDIIKMQLYISRKMNIWKENITYLNKPGQIHFAETYRLDDKILIRKICGHSKGSWYIRKY